MILRCAARNGGADSSRRGAAPISSPQEGQIPQASRRALELGPRGLAYLVGTRKLRVCHELFAKREDEAKRLLLLKGQGKRV
jgi:hypothetical protein